MACGIVLESNRIHILKRLVAEVDPNAISPNQKFFLIILDLDFFHTNGCIFLVP